MTIKCRPEVAKRNAPKKKKRLFPFISYIKRNYNLSLDRI